MFSWKIEKKTYVMVVFDIFKLAKSKYLHLQLSSLRCNWIDQLFLSADEVIGNRLAICSR